MLWSPTANAAVVLVTGPVTLQRQVLSHNIYFDLCEMSFPPLSSHKGIEEPQSQLQIPATKKPSQKPEVGGLAS